MSCSKNPNLKGVYKELNVSLKNLTVGFSSSLPIVPGPGHSVYYSDIVGREDPEGIGSILGVIKNYSSRNPDGLKKEARISRNNQELRRQERGKPWALGSPISLDRK